VWSTCTAGYASFVIEPEQHGFCASTASELSLSYAADVLLCKSCLNGITFHTPHLRLQTSWLSLKIYIKFRVFLDNIVRSDSSAIYERYGKTCHLLLQGECREKLSLKCLYTNIYKYINSFIHTYIRTYMASYLRSPPSWHLSSLDSQCSYWKQPAYWLNSAEPCIINWLIINYTIKTNITRSMAISGFSCVVDENFTLLGYYAASRGNSLPTFWDNLSVSSSRIKNPKKIFFDKSHNE
jgi:hypothetical protein